jgi:hypothetical protein
MSIMTPTLLCADFIVTIETFGGGSCANLFPLTRQLACLKEIDCMH